MVTAQNNPITLNKTSYFHIYRDEHYEKIFIDSQDFQIFIKFLKEYFSDKNLQNVKKTFTIRGHTYQGIPHLPQNFSNQIELLAYKLEPNRFDLLIKESIPGVLPKFIRAISTRYAIYYNKKHHRTGSLFRDTYKLEQIRDLSLLSHLIHILHSNFSKKEGVPDHFYSSYPEYLGQRVTNWVNPQAILSNLGLNNYKHFIENSQPRPKTQKPTSSPKSKPRIPEIILSTLVLILFSSYSVIKIKTSSPSKTLISPYSAPLHTEVLGEKDKVIVVINLPDNLESVSIYQNPSTSSAKIRETKDNDSFEFISENSGWYQVKLSGESTGYISSRYSEIRKDND